jgi:hypothetical protein
MYPAIAHISKPILWAGKLPGAMRRAPVPAPGGPVWPSWCRKLAGFVEEERHKKQLASPAVAGIK